MNEDTQPIESGIPILDPSPANNKRFIFYVGHTNPRYSSAIEQLPPEDSGIIRKIIFEKWKEAREITEAWSRGDNEWIAAWQAFDEARRKWYSTKRGNKPVFTPPAEVVGDPAHALLPIPDITNSEIRVTYRLWIPEGRRGQDHQEFVTYVNGYSERDKRKGKFQMLMRLALVLAAEDPDIHAIIRGM